MKAVLEDLQQDVITKRLQAPLESIDLRKALKEMRR